MARFQEDRRAAAENEEEKEEDANEGGTMLGQYVSDDEEEMTCDDVKAYLLRLYQSGRIDLEEYLSSMRWVQDKSSWTKGEWKQYVRERKAEERRRILKAVQLVKRIKNWSMLWRKTASLTLSKARQSLSALCAACAFLRSQFVFSNQLI